MQSIEPTRNLLRSVRQLLHHQRQKEILRGESFNVFSVLGMEARENETHSAMLSALLNPRGSHLKRDTFLRLFLEAIGDEILDPETAKVVVEKSIGARDDEAKTGGRVDIFISDSKGRCITIENKIHAGDQNAQLERYCNHRVEQGSVYYLTLQGEEPSEASKGQLESGKDFHLLSYKKEIIDWLRLCLKESVEQPILRETIRQYILLLQKLTGTMNAEESKELHALLLEHYEEATVIANNVIQAKNKLTEGIRQEVLAGLKKRLDKRYIVEGGGNTSQRFSSIWIWGKEIANPIMHFGIESFSGQGHFRGLSIGIVNKSGKKSTFAGLPGSTPYNNWWGNVATFKPLEGIDIDLGNGKTLARLVKDTAFQERFVRHIIDESESFIDAQYPTLKSFLLSQSKPVTTNE